MITTRVATPDDTPGMADLLNAIITAGGTTALTEPVDAASLTDWMNQNPTRSAWYVAVDPAGEIMGFQWIEPDPTVSEDGAGIATFVRIGLTGSGIGGKLFRETEAAARQLGYTWINANIRSDNTGGLAYYQSRGFRDYGHLIGYRLDNGQVVDKTLKRYDL